MLPATWLPAVWSIRQTVIVSISETVSPAAREDNMVDSVPDEPLPSQHRRSDVQSDRTKST